MAKKMWFENHVAEWRALLGAFRIHCNVEMENTLLNKFLNWNHNATGQVVLLNIYAVVDNKHLCKNVEWLRKETSVKKQSG